MKPGRARSSWPAPGRWAPLTVLFGIWVLLSGKLDGFHLGIGLLAVLFVGRQGRALAPLEGADGPSLRYGRVAPYLGWLFWQMVMSAVHVARVVLVPRRHLDPQLVQFRCGQPTLMAGVILANSITLTPGTLTVEMQGDRFVVHALTAKTARELLEGGMARRVARLFTDDPLPPIEVITGPREMGAE